MWESARGILQVEGTAWAKEVGKQLLCDGSSEARVGELRWGGGSGGRAWRRLCLTRILGGGYPSFAGISRSTTIVTAYVMTVTGLGWRDVLEAIKATRPIANPNPGFRQQLEEFGWGSSRKVGAGAEAGAGQGWETLLPA